MNDPMMSPERLRQSLQRLHAELAQTPSVDDASRQVLRDVLGDIERLLRNAGDANAPAATQSRLEALAVDFESEHPALAASVREFVDLLGRAGL